MTIYKVFPDLDERNASLVFAKEIDDFERYSFSGERISNWNPVGFEWRSVNPCRSESQVINDVILVFGAGVDIAVNERTRKILSEIFPSSFQFLPITVLSETNNWYLLNPLTSVENAIDLQKSTFRTRRNGSRGRLLNAVFLEKNIPNDSIFTCPEAPTTVLAKGDLLHSTIQEHQITGLKLSAIEQLSNQEAI